MTNNDILRRIRYTFDLKDSEVIDIFALAEYKATEQQVTTWLRKDEDAYFRELTDKELATFLNGFINLKRGKREGPQPEPEERLNNNLIFRKLRIALNLQAEDIIDILQQVGFRLSKHELSAFFRKPGNKNYRMCKDQVLRNFLQGVQHKFRPGSS